MDGYLAQAPLFQTLPTTQVKHLAERCELRRFRKGQMLFQEGQSADSIWLIQRGWVYLIRRTPLGTQATIYTVTPEDGLCGFSTVVGEGSYFASAVAATDTTAIRIPKEEFAHLLKQQPTFAGAVLAIYHSRMRHLAEAISLASSPVEQRLAYTLLRLKGTFGKTIPVTHQELAQMAGTRWETSIRTLSTFKRKRWLATSRGKITVLRPDQLKLLLRQESRKDDLHHGMGGAESLT
jgi:CRP/FNR family transcriptional regulator